jgi:hypothetical protein
MMRRAASVPLVVLVTLSTTVACGSSTEYLVRVQNLRAAAITVQIGPADYGSVAPQATTDYQRVNEGDNTMLVNGVESARSPVSFGEGLSGAHHWTYTFEESGEGFVSDDTIFPTAALAWGADSGRIRVGTTTTRDHFYAVPEPIDQTRRWPDGPAARRTPL